MNVDEYHSKKTILIKMQHPIISSLGDLQLLNEMLKEVKEKLGHNSKSTSMFVLFFFYFI